MNNILWNGPTFDGSGYARAMRDYIYWLDKFEFNIKINTVTYNNEDPRRYLSNEQIEYFNNFELPRSFVGGSDWVYINHCTPDIALTNKSFKNNLLYSVWETDKIPDNAAELVNKFDGLLTASKFSMDSFINSGIEIPIYVLPHIVERRDLPDNKNIKEVIDSANVDLVFLSVFEWHIGKGYDILLKGFIDAFKNDSKVLLLLKVNSFVYGSKLENMVKKYIKELKGDLKYPKIIPICKPVREDIFYSLYRYSDVFVLPSRREAFCLPAADAIVNNKLVVIPDKGGHREFLNEDNCVLIKSDWEEIDYLEDSRRNYKGQKWIEPDYLDFVNKLIYIRENWTNRTEEDVNDLNNESDIVMNKLSPENIINKFKGILGKIY